jgi:Tol biopolymer transport system component
LQRFVDARLLVSDRDNEGRETLEVAHEALLRAWPRLRVWLDEDQDKLRLRETIRRAAEAWHERGGDEDWLDHRGSRLEAADTLVREARFALTDPAERAYLDACLERRRREEEAVGALREQEAKAERDRLRRARLFAAVTTVLFAISAGFGYFAWHQWSTAEVALAQEKSANSRRLATASDEQTDAGDAELGILVALEALAVADTDQARAALEKGVFRLHEPMSLPVLDEVVLWVEFSPDGRRVVTASADGIARIWDAASGQVLTEFTGHQALIYTARFGPDGAHVATASGDGTAQVWDAETGKSVTVLSDHGRDVYVAAFSPDGQRLVTASDDGTARVWDLGKGESTVLEGHEEWLNDAAFNPDGARVVTAAADGTARIWDAATGAELLVLRGHLDSINSARFSPDGNRVVTASDDDTARLWDATSGAEIGLLQGHGGYVLAARFSRDGQRIVTASADGTARIWDGKTGASQVVLRGHGKEVLSAEFSPDGQLVVTASADGLAGVWDADDGAGLAVLAGHFGPVRQARFSPDGQRIVTASDDGTARLWWTRRFASFDELLEVAPSLPRRSLSVDERQTLSLD